MPDEELQGRGLDDVILETQSGQIEGLDVAPEVVLFLAAASALNLEAAQADGNDRSGPGNFADVLVPVVHGRRIDQVPPS